MMACGLPWFPFIAELEDLVYALRRRMSDGITRQGLNLDWYGLSFTVRCDSPTLGTTIRLRFQTKAALSKQFGMTNDVSAQGLDSAGSRMLFVKFLLSTNNAC